jgi:hypothetical protein
MAPEQSGAFFRRLPAGSTPRCTKRSRRSRATAGTRARCGRQKNFRLSSELIRVYPKVQAVHGEAGDCTRVLIVDLIGPGHIGVRIKDNGQSLIPPSNILFPVVHPARADVNLIFEQDRQQPLRMNSARY